MGRRRGLEEQLGEAGEPRMECEMMGNTDCARAEQTTSEKLRARTR